MPDAVNHTVSAASDEPNAKRQKMEAKKFLKDLPADEFIWSVPCELRVVTRKRANE